MKKTKNIPVDTDLNNYLHRAREKKWADFLLAPTSTPANRQDTHRKETREQLAMSTGFNYSKWDNIELSDDEDDVHPNIERESWFRMKVSARRWAHLCRDLGPVGETIC